MGAEFITFMISSFAIVIVFLILFFMFAPKFVARMSKKMTKEMLEVQKEIIEDNEADLRFVSDKSADISSGAITKKARAVKEGLQGESIYCKLCGAKIDADSKFCKECGKQQ